MIEWRMEINNEKDIITARTAVRKAAHRMGLSMSDETKIAIVTSELARNIFLHAGRGFVECREMKGPEERVGLEMVFEDNGPGIPDVELAMQPGYSTVGRLGIGLPGSRRFVDEFSIESRAGRGTIVRTIIWKN